MRKRGATLLAATLLLCCATVAPRPATAETIRVDDSATLPADSTVLLRWRQLVPSAAAQDTLEGSVAVAVRLNLVPVLNRTGRLYLVLPAQGAVPVRVSWATQGRLLPGEIMPGQRVAVMQGTVTTPYLEDTLALRIEADGNHLPDMQRLAFHFEFDAD